MFYKKQIFKLNTLKQLLTDERSCVSLVSTRRLLALPPFFLNDMKSGILYMLNAMLKKYDRSLGGIVIGYQNIKVLMDENTGIIPIGTSETEVNISVEFYIFQPKIGNYLEGIINKKSNNHIGCLVHKYFNATILKPEDIDYDDWICKDLSVDDKITFKVKDLDFTRLLPYIEGIIDDRNSAKSIERNMTCNVDNVIMNHVNESSENESKFSKKLFENVSSKDKKFQSEFLYNKKAKSRNEEEVSVLEDSINSSSGEFNSFTSPKKEKKKKKQKVDLEFDDHSKKEEEATSKDKYLTLGSFNNEYKAEESHFKKKKKKKEKNKHKSDDQVLNAVKGSTKEEDPMMSFLEKCFQVENENSDNFVKEEKNKIVKRKKKKKKKEEKPSLDFNKTSTCLPAEEVEDNMLYSTQLDPVSERKKMKMPHFSPILPLDKKRNNELTTRILDFSTYSNSDKESQEKEKKRKHKKRKAEEKNESAGEPAPKKMKTSPASEKKAPQVEVNGVDVESDTQSLLEEMYKKLLNEAKEQLSVSDTVSSKVRKKKKESKNREKKATQSELSKNSMTQVNTSKEKSEVQNVLDKLLEDEIKRVNENSDASDRKKNKSHDKSKTNKQEKKLLKEKSKSSSLKAKKSSKTSISFINGEDEKFEVH